MKPVRTIEGRAYPLTMNNIDTDLIIPAAYLKTVTREGLGKGAFETLRAQAGNIFDDPQFYRAPILIVGDNFGCGSSREHAAWALLDMGIEAVISPGFSDIFASNAFKNGILTVTLSPSAVERIASAAWSRAISIDLPAQTVTVGPDEMFVFDIDPFRKHCLLEGVDEIDITLGQGAAIEAFETLARATSPWLQPQVSQPPRGT